MLGKARLNWSAMPLPITPWVLTVLTNASASASSRFPRVSSITVISEASSTSRV